MNTFKLLDIDLRRFDGGNAGSAGNSGGEASTGGVETQAAPGSDQPAIKYQSKRKGHKSGEAQAVVYGKRADAPADAGADTLAAGEREDTAARTGQDSDVVITSNTGEDKRKEFERLISEDYRDEFTQRMQQTINRRFKEVGSLKAQLEGQGPVIDMLMQRYGVEDGDVGKLQKAIEADGAYWTQAAEEAGMTVDQYKAYQTMARENEALKRAEAERQGRERANSRIGDWMRQGEELRGEYPDFNLDREVKNPQFLAMLKAGVPVRHAYEVSHIDDIKTGIAARVTKSTEKKVVDTIRAKGARPAENGVSGQGAVVQKADVSQLTKRDRAEIARRVARGERIEF